MFHPFLFTLCQDHVTHRDDWVMKDHPRSRKAHDRTDLFAHFRLVAMYTAVGAECLVLHKGTFITALSGIFGEFCTFRAEHAFFCGVLLSAVKRDHLADHPFFPLTLSLYVLQDTLPFSMAITSSAIRTVDLR